MIKYVLSTSMYEALSIWCAICLLEAVGQSCERPTSKCFIFLNLQNINQDCEYTPTDHMIRVIQYSTGCSNYWHRHLAWWWLRYFHFLLCFVSVWWGIKLFLFPQENIGRGQSILFERITPRKFIALRPHYPAIPTVSAGHSFMIIEQIMVIAASSLYCKPPHTLQLYNRSASSTQKG